jgi:wobble nucleotide-excising tRNase
VPSSPAATNSNSSQQSNQQQRFSVDPKALEMIQKLQQHYNDQVAELGKRNTEAILNIIKVRASQTSRIVAIVAILTRFYLQTGTVPRALPPSYAELEARVRALESHNAKAMSVVKQLQADIEELRKVCNFLGFPAKKTLKTCDHRMDP